MLHKHLEWRKNNQIDDILDNWQVPEVLEKYYSMGVCGNDKYGCPSKPFYSVIIAMILKKCNIHAYFRIVWISAFGNIDVKGLMMSVSKKSYVRFFAYMAERSHKEMHCYRESTGKPVTKQTVILDLANLSPVQMTFKPCKISSLSF